MTLAAKHLGCKQQNMLPAVDKLYRSILQSHEQNGRQISTADGADEPTTTRMIAASIAQNALSMDTKHTNAPCGTRKRTNERFATSVTIGDTKSTKDIASSTKCWRQNIAKIATLMDTGRSTPVNITSEIELRSTLQHIFPVISMVWDLKLRQTSTASFSGHFYTESLTDMTSFHRHFYGWTNCKFQRQFLSFLEWDTKMTILFTVISIVGHQRIQHVFSFLWQTPETKACFPVISMVKHDAFPGWYNQQHVLPSPLWFGQSLAKHI